jgi:hypothetical protein
MWRTGVTGEIASVKRARKPRIQGLEASSVIVDELSPKALHNLESHSLTAREQIMRQWPENDWEIRLWQ